eukprot:COSAG01_NODE_12054_length_1807_cov_1.317916_1_plen_204_part_00
MPVCIPDSHGVLSGRILLRQASEDWRWLSARLSETDCVQHNTHDNSSETSTLAGAITAFTDNRDNTDSDLHDIGTLLSNAAADTDPLLRQLQTTRDAALHTYKKLAVLRPYGLPDTEWQRCNATLLSAACNLHAQRCHSHDLTVTPGSPAETPSQADQTTEPIPTRPQVSILKSHTNVASITVTPSLLAGDKHPSHKHRLRCQ